VFSLRLRRLSLANCPRMERSAADHARLVDALEDRDAEPAAALANVLGVLRVLERMLGEDGAG